MKSTLRRFQIIMFVILLAFVITVVHAKRNTACSVDFSLIGSKCYHFSKDSRNWSDAYYQCLAKNSSLAVLQSFTEDKHLKSYLRRHFRSSDQNSRWIGLKYDWKNEKWVWAETGRPVNYSNFSSTQGETKGAEWTCGELDALLGNKWSYRSCLDKNPYICQKDPRYSVRPKKKPNSYDCEKNVTDTQRKNCRKNRNNRGNYDVNIPSPLIQTTRPITTTSNIKEYVCPSNMFIIKNRCYYFSHDKHRWNDAYWACRDNKSYLAIIHSKRQDKRLRELLSSGLVGKFERWIGGLYDWKQNRWLWASSGKAMKYQGFPSKKNRGSQFEWRSIILDPKLNYKWNARLRTDRKHYICQRRAKTIAKVEQVNADKYSSSAESSNSDKSIDSNQVPML